MYNSDKDNRAGQDPSDSGKLVCGGRLQNGEITGVPAGNDEAYEESYGGEGKTVYFDTQNADIFAGGAAEKLIMICPRWCRFRLITTIR